MQYLSLARAGRTDGHLSALDRDLLKTYKFVQD